MKTDMKGRMFQVEREVKKFDPLSTSIFSCVLEEIFKQME